MLASIHDNGINDLLLQVKGLTKYFPIRKGLLSRVAGQIERRVYEFLFTVTHHKTRGSTAAGVAPAAVF
jgi:hypothetical protein